MNEVSVLLSKFFSALNAEKTFKAIAAGDFVFH